jgi:tRNA (guanine-N7-)-methyltransferase
MQPRQKTKSWITERIWVNPYWYKLQEHPGKIFLEQDIIDDPSAFKEFIAQYSDVICEFGSGSGEHLLELARLNPNSAVIGFELRFKRVVKTIEKAKRAGLTNVFVVCGYAQNVSHLFASNSIQEVFINFPDPWEKKIKNRLINEVFISELNKLLIDKGKLSFKTDHVDYFFAVKDLFENSKLFDLIFCSEDLHSDLPKEKIILTEFERLFLSQNLKIHALACQSLKASL